MRKFKSMVSGYLIGAMVLTLIPVNAWAETREEQIKKEEAYTATPSNVGNSGLKTTPSDAKPKCICNDICSDDDVNKKCPVCSEDYDECSWAIDMLIDDDLATPSDASLLDASPYDPVPYEEIILDGREFSTIISNDEAPLYYVIKYTVPKGRGGYYSFGGGKHSQDTYYVCNESQYELLCKRIEKEGEPVSATASVDCLETEDYDTLSYQLEEEQDYYFISAWHKYFKHDTNKLLLTRDIDVDLYSSGVTNAGTSTLYSKGSEWSFFSSRAWNDVAERITCPERSEYRFNGYYTAVDGQGTQVIDDFGNILPEMNELNSDCTVYACWKQFSPISFQEIRLEGRSFSEIVTGGVSPYYRVFKFTVPESSGGYYSFYEGNRYNIIISGSYLCTPEQYKRICHKIEQNKGAVRSLESMDCLTYQWGGSSLYYKLEAGKDYYFISTIERDDVGIYKVVLEHEITVTLEVVDAEQSGTMAIYSKCGDWLELGTTYHRLTSIERPKREGYKFAGYFTRKNGEGLKVIDYDGEILSELAELDGDATVYAHWEEFGPITYEEISLVDRRSEVIGIAEQTPYFKLLKYKVPEHGNGYYSLSYNSDDVDLVAYLCTPAQYEALCRMIEVDRCAPSFGNTAVDCLASSGFSDNISYQLEAGEEYYFIATRRWIRNTGEYQLLFRRDIEVKLDATGVDNQRTTVLYSKGDGWSDSAERYRYCHYINTPWRDGYMFAGYYTEKDGRGTMVIDQDGYILDELSDLKSNQTVYAFWEESWYFERIQLKNGIKGELYQYKFESNYGDPLYWEIVYGDLPAGLSLDEDTGVISGIPTELGKETFGVIAFHYYFDEYFETSITITSRQDSSDDEENIGKWLSDEEGWKYYTSGDRYYSNEWKRVEYNGELYWYHFGKNGYIDTGWFADSDGKWYYLNPVSNGTKGAMQTGWLTDPQDGNRYYLDLQTGQMVTGWVYIDESWCYFNEVGVANSGWKWDEAANAWSYENLGGRPLGALEPDKEKSD